MSRRLIPFRLAKVGIVHPVNQAKKTNYPPAKCPKCGTLVMPPDTVATLAPEVVSILHYGVLGKGCLSPAPISSIKGALTCTLVLLYRCRR